MSRDIVIARSDRDIERAITHPDMDYELYRASRRRFVPVMDRGRMRVMAVHRDPYRGTALTNKWIEPVYSNPTVGTAKNTFTSEFQLNDTAGMGPVWAIPGYYFAPGTARGKMLRVVARGVQLGTGSTPPTWLLNIRFNPVVTPAVPPTGPIIGGMPAAITGTTTANSMWEAELDVQMAVEAAAGNNATLRGLGEITSPRGFASPFSSELFAGGASPGTVATFDHSLLNTLTIGMICGTSLAANQMQLLQLIVFGQAD